jgi:tetratricopeptide (TPR) repeat protein
MGIKYEDAGDWIRALKMYTIGYRIRRDNLSPSHPSLVVLLNMLGSIQVKRDELEEAMEIFELALKDDPRLMGDGSRHDGNTKDAAVSDDNDEDDDNEFVNRDEDGHHVHEHKEADLSPPRHRRKGQSRLERNGTSITNNVLAKSVAYREMGIIYERWGDADEALRMYHRSLDCIAEYKGLMWEPPVIARRAPGLSLTADEGPSPRGALPIVSPPPGAAAAASSPSRSASTSRDTRSPSRSVTNTSSSADEDVNNTTISSCPVSLSNEQDILLDLESVQLSRSFVKHATVVKSHKEDDGQFESGMELFLNGDDEGSSRTLPAPLITSTCYDAFFQGTSANAGRKKSKNKDASTANVDVALTLHQIGQLHRAEGEYNLALAAYAVSLRGMREELGKNHPNVAAILGNIGNLQKEMGDLTAAYETYQQVLAIESYRLGLSHPDVAVTLHNIATIDAARGNHQNALILYEQVLSLQRKLFGEDHMSLAVTATCMGDVYERIGEIDKAIDAFDEALRIKTAVSGRHSIEVGRILHKLGKLSALNGDVQLADSYLSRTVLIYRLNKMRDDDGWMIEVNRDVADIDALIAMGRSEDLFEC